MTLRNVYPAIFRPLMALFFILGWAFGLAAQNCAPSPSGITYTPDGGDLSDRLLADFQPSVDDQADFDGDELAYAMSASNKQVGPPVCVSIQSNGQYGFNGIEINRANDCYEAFPFGGRIIDVDPTCPDRSSELALQIADQTGQGNFEGYLFVVYDPDVDEFFVVGPAGGGTFNGTDEGIFGSAVDNPPVDPNDPTSTPTQQDIPESGTSTPPSDNTSTLNGTLPVELAQFSGYYEEKRVLLNWTTTSETNNDYFEVQRANPTTGAFEPIGQVAGANAAEEGSNYTFTDLDYAAGDNLYRLKQTDFDGSSTLSRVISVYAPTAPENGLRLDAFPNPAADVINLRAAGLTGETGRAELYAATGRLVRTLVVNSGNNQFGIGDLPAGVYQLRLVDGKNQTATRVVVR